LSVINILKRDLSWREGLFWKLGCAGPLFLGFSSSEMH
jgi:hypothetical protein